MHSVYTTKTGVRIGLAYERPRKIEMSRDAELLQRALLQPGARIPIRREVLVDRICWVLSVIMLLGVVLVGSHVFAL